MRKEWENAGFEANPVLELTYRGEIIGWIDCACALMLLYPDELWLNRAVANRLGG